MAATTRVVTTFCTSELDSERSYNLASGSKLSSHLLSLPHPWQNKVSSHPKMPISEKTVELNLTHVIIEKVRHHHQRAAFAIGFTQSKRQTTVLM